MINKKKKICKECKKEKYIFSKGKCQNCTTTNTLKQTPLKKSFTSIRKVTDRKIKKYKVTKEKRDVYFNHHIKKCRFSEESFKPINNPNKSNICHLFDKSRHPSLQDNFENCIYLTFKEHERFDKLLYSHEFNKIEKEFKNSWSKTCTVLKDLLYLCLENTVFTRAVKKYLDGR